MSAFTEIDSIVKAAGLFEKNRSEIQNACVSKNKQVPVRKEKAPAKAEMISGMEPLTLNEVKGILSRGGGGTEYPVISGGKGVYGTTPENARIALWRRIFKRELGDKYDQNAADAAAKRSLEVANRKRYEALSRQGYPVKGKFDPYTLYAVPPHWTDVYPPNKMNAMATSFGRVDSFIPFVRYIPKNEKDKTLGTLKSTRRQYRPGGSSEGKNVSLALADTGEVESDVVGHEGVHAQATKVYPSSSSGWATFRGNDDAYTKDGRKGVGYAIDPGELLVALGAEKPRLIANGKYVSTGLGRVLAKDVIENWDKLGKPTREDNVMNVYSLRRIIKELYDKAHSKDATDADKANYEALLDRLDHDIEFVRNGKRLAPGSRRSWRA